MDVGTECLYFCGYNSTTVIFAMVIKREGYAWRGPWTEVLGGVKRLEAKTGRSRGEF